MFLHLGNDKSVAAQEVIGIFDYDIMDMCLACLPAESINTDGLAEDTLPKSVILTDKTAYLSVIAPLTLVRRCNILNGSVI